MAETPQPAGDSEQMHTTEGGTDTGTIDVSILAGTIDVSLAGTIDVSILGGRKFTGRWRPPKTMTMLSVLGGREIDLREAEIPADGITINVVGLIGGTHVIVPDGINVEVSGFSGLGGRRVDSHAEPGAPGERVVRLNVFGALGGLKVESQESS